MCTSMALASMACTALTNSAESMSHPPITSCTCNFDVSAALVTVKHAEVRGATSAETRQAARSEARLLGSGIIGARVRVRRRSGVLGQRGQVADRSRLVEGE